jgi:hypothetical protein
MAKKNKIPIPMVAGGLALVGGIGVYLWASGTLDQWLGTAPSAEAPLEPAPVAPAVIPGVTDYPTLTETLNKPAPPATAPQPYVPPATTPVDDDYVPPCPTGYTGTWPNCKPPTPKCPTNWTGVYPNCYPPATPTCPTGWTGAYPSCVPPTPVYKCPTGWTGTYPNCVPPAPVYKCPTGWTGTYPNCSPPVAIPPPTSTCVRNQSTCSNTYHGKCNTECRSPSSSVCKACRCACEGVSANLALSYAGGRYSDDGVQDRAYYVTAYG